MALSDSGGNTTFLWNAGGSASDDNGGSAKTTLWVAQSEDASKFMNVSTGAAISAAQTWGGSKSACSVGSGAGDTVQVTSPGSTDFINALTGTVANFQFTTQARRDDL